MGTRDDKRSDRERSGPPAISRLGRSDDRRYRMLSRRAPSRDRLPRHRRQLPVAELIGLAIKAHGLTDAARQHCVFIFWDEMVGVRFATKIAPDSLAEGVLNVSASSSPWVHEMQFFKAKLIAQINAWADAQRVWLGPSPLVTDIRFALGSRKRELLVDPDYVRRLQQRQLRRLRPRDPAAPAGDAELLAIRAETSRIDDDELRATIENVRARWNL